MSKTQLHALIAVETDRKKTIQKIVDETEATFRKRIDHFSGMSKTYRPFNDADRDLPATEQKKLATTVPEKLDYFEKMMAGYLDVALQKELTNAGAVGDIIIEKDNGEKETIATAVPVQYLVQLENHLTDLRSKIYDAIPTLDPNIFWEADKTQKNVHRTPPLITVRTKKEKAAMELAPATERYPAQVQLVEKDVPCGEFTTLHFSGMITSAEKHEILARLDQVLTAVKMGRATANQTEIIVNKIGQKIFNFIRPVKEA